MFAQENKIIIAVMRLSVKRISALATHFIRPVCEATIMGGSNSSGNACARHLSYSILY
jgi:hypothetical protein